ncbi:MAG: septum formation family protein [Nocardioides sp.]
MLGTNQRMTRAGMLGLVLAVTMSGCSGGTVEPPPVEPTRPAVAQPDPAPADRACYALDYQDALAPSATQEAVGCGQAHTSQTFLVGELTTTVDHHLLASDSDRVRTATAARCRSALPGFLGLTAEDLRLTMLRSVWFAPNRDQASSGSNWFRCDVIAVATDSELAEFTGGLAGDMADPSVLATYRMCGTASPDSDDFERVVCSREHTWRVLRSVDLPAGDYPGVDSVTAAGQQICQDAAQDVADNALDFAWGYEWPSAEQWTSGQTWGLCWAPV